MRDIGMVTAANSGAEAASPGPRRVRVIEDDRETADRLVDTNVIDVSVGRPRKKLDDGQAYPLIHAVRGVGLRLRAPE
jgi:hypothetical protein